MNIQLLKPSDFNKKLREHEVDLLFYGSYYGSKKNCREQSVPNVTVLFGKYIPVLVLRDHPSISNLTHH